MLPVQGGRASYETHIANNIRRKRYFGEISTGHAICTVSSDSERNVDIQCKDASQDLKKLILAKKDSKTSPILILENTKCETKTTPNGNVKALEKAGGKAKRWGK